MDEQLRIILIIIVSVSIFGLLVFVFVKNYLRSRINQMVKEDKKINQSSLIIFSIFIFINIHYSLRSFKVKTISCKK